MAKKSKVTTKTVEGNQVWEVNPNTKDNVWVYDTSSTSLQFQIVSAEGYSIPTDNQRFFIRQGNDLVFFTFFENTSNNSIKKITNTIKNYYKSEQNVNISVKYNSTTTQLSDLLYTSVSGNVFDSLYSDNLLYGSKKSDTYHIKTEKHTDILDEDGKDTYKILSENPTSANHIRDLKGNDNYFLASKKTGSFSDIVRDYAGNDKYKVTNATSVSLYDYKGNDNYEANGESLARITDYKGNDKYTFDRTAKASGISDYAGNDTYNVYNIMTSGNFLNINDHAGNDKYNYINDTSDTNKNIYDHGGKDVYNIQGANVMTINDYSNNDKKVTNDTYNISNSTKIKINEISSSEGKKIASGNDTYNFNGVDNNGISLSYGHKAIEDSAGNDKYNIKNSNKVSFLDSKGKDTWNLSYSQDLIVTDVEGNDKWNLTAVANSTNENHYTDYKGNDVWNIKSATSIKALDVQGDDKYSISENSYNVNLQDNKGNDSYTVKNSSYVNIVDNGAGNDKYTFNNYFSKQINEHYVTDDGGNDKYSATNSSGIGFIDQGGNDTYNVKNINTFTIGDNAKSVKTDDVKQQEKNTFNIQNVNEDLFSIVAVNTANYDSENNKVADYISNDTFNLTSNRNLYVLKQDEGSDKYNIKSNKGLLSIEEYGGDDKYSVDKLTGNIKINDKAGDKDSLTISKSKAKNLVFMANFDLSTTNLTSDVKDGSLFIFDKKSSGFVEIKDFFKTETHGFAQKYVDKDADGAGFIENIYAGKSNVSSSIASYKNKCETGLAGCLGQEVAAWLSDKGYSSSTYSSIETIMNSDIANDFIATFVSKQ